MKGFIPSITVQPAGGAISSPSLTKVLFSFGANLLMLVRQSWKMSGYFDGTMMVVTLAPQLFLHPFGQRVTLTCVWVFWEDQAEQFPRHFQRNQAAKITFYFGHKTPKDKAPQRLAPEGLLCGSQGADVSAAAL
jgi:hypothetical protein